MRNPGRQQYYDPIVEEPTQEAVPQLQMRGIAVSEPGVYILLDDFIDAIRSYAFGADDPKKQQAIYELIGWFEETDTLSAITEEDPLQIAEDADKIELYPDADGKWHSRLIDSNGNVMGQINDGSFDRNWVEQDTFEKYPDLEVIQLESENEDSTWKHMGPSKRLWSR